MKRTEFLDPATITLLMGLAVGLGIAVHDGFFLVALGIGGVALGQSVLHAIKEHSDQLRMGHRHS
jgi:predicted Co/Zn/Cd cation transporter (cation efflux family)